MSFAASYQLLPAIDTEQGDEWGVTGRNRHDGKHNHHAHEQGTRSLLYWAFAAALLCSLLNIVVLGYKSIDWKPSAPTPRRLEYASTYMGLKDAYHDPTAPPLQPITNFPIVIAQVNESQPHAVSVDTHRIASSFGTFYPENRRVLISSKESTFNQFYAGDFGMERCALKSVVLPSPGEIPTAHPFGGSSGASIEIWRVHAERPLDVHTLSYARRPQRQSIFTSWDLTSNQTLESTEFECPSGSFLTFELSCGGCLVDFRQVPTERDLGFWLVQRPSI